MPSDEIVDRLSGLPQPASAAAPGFVPPDAAASITRLPTPAFPKVRAAHVSSYQR
jgi:hypothetical protein